MTVVLETIAIVAGCAAIYKLLKEMRGNLEPSEEAMKEIKKAEKLIKGFTYKKFDENYLCEAFKEIGEKDFPAFVDELQDRFQLDKETKGSILDIMRTEARQGHRSAFKFNEGRGNTYYEHMIVVKSDGMINLAIARYTLSFKLTAMFEEWYLLGFIPLKRKVTASDKKPLTMSEGQKEMYRKLCQDKLFKHVDEKCKNEEIKA